MSSTLSPIRFAQGPAETARLQAEIRALAKEKGAVIIAHNYQKPEVQDVADFVGDSLGLSREAASTNAKIVVFCGVHFMAETAAMLAPDKTVLLPELGAGCSLADSINADELREWKRNNPGAVVVSYVNTTAAVKAESDYCCTSSNAAAIIAAIPADKTILFLPDMFLGTWLERVTGRKMKVWLGECHVHAGIKPADLRTWQKDRPETELLVHPECGCASQAMAFADDGVKILSTEKMITYAKASEATSFMVATETGILHRLRKEMPDKQFDPLREDAICKYMKMTSLESVRDALLYEQHVITVPADIADKARLAIRRMVDIG